MAASSEDPADVPALRPVYVLTPPSPLFAAHWSLFIPESQESSFGRRIHVSGDRLNGFKLEIIRGYDASLHRGLSSSRHFRIGNISPSKYGTFSGPSTRSDDAQKDDDEGGGYVDNYATDELERVCLEVEAPGPSLNRVVASEAGRSSGPRPKMEVKDCQWWVRQVVQLAYSRGILLASQSPDGTEGKDPTVLLESLPAH